MDTTLHRLSRLRTSVLRHGAIIAAIAMSLAGVSLVMWYVGRVSSTIALQAAIRNAAHLNRALQEFRTLYTSEVVERVRPHGIVIAHDYDQRDRSIPLPATLTMLLGGKLTESETGEGGRLYSAYPFPWRVDGGPRDEFEREALRRLTADPTEPFYRLEEGEHGGLLRYATADLMRPSCVSCHNSHPDTPKNDWETGDVRGVLSTTVNLGEASATSTHELRGILALLLGMALIGSCGLVVTLRGQREKAKREVTRAAEQERTRRQNEELARALRLAKNQQRALDQHAFVSITDIKGDIIYVNDKFCEISGYSREELLGQNHRMVQSDEHSSEFFRELWKTIAGGDVWSGVIKNRKKDGSFYWVEATIVPFMNDRGKPEKYVAIRTDVSAIRFAEDKIAAANAELLDFNNAAVDRELRMIELKKEINVLSVELGHGAHYDVSFDDCEPATPEPMADARRENRRVGKES